MLLVLLVLSSIYVADSPEHILLNIFFIYHNVIFILYLLYVAHM